MEKDPKQPFIHNTLQEELESNKKEGEQIVTENENTLAEHRKKYQSLLASKNELTGTLETAKRNNDTGKITSTQKELDDVVSALAAYDREFHKSSIDQSITIEKAESASLERNRHLH